MYKHLRLQLKPAAYTNPERIELGDIDTLTVQAVCGNFDSGVITLSKSNCPDAEDTGIAFDSPWTIAAAGIHEPPDTTLYSCRFLVVRVTTSASSDVVCDLYICVKKLNPIQVIEA